MPSDLLATAVREDQERLLDRLEALEAGKGDGKARDQFLDEWVEYSGAVGLILFDAARHHLDGGQDLVDSLRKEAESSGFEEKFTQLENADDDAIVAVAKKTAPVFKADTKRVQQKLVLPLQRELDEDVVADLAEAYRKKRPAP